MSPSSMTTYPETGAPWRILRKKNPNVYPNRLLYAPELKKTHGRYKECLPTAAGKVEEDNSGESWARVQSV